MTTGLANLSRKRERISKEQWDKLHFSMGIFHIRI